jgi:hypothetical protein
MAALVPIFEVKTKAERTPLELSRDPENLRVAALLVYLLQSGPKAKRLESKTTGDYLQVW